MSAYREIKTQFKNEKSLLKALDDLGLTVRDVSPNRQNTFGLVGYGRSVEGNTKVAIRLPKSHYNGYEDVGFAWDADEKAYKAIVSTHDGVYHNIRNVGQKTLQKITQRYAYHEAVRLAKIKGYAVKTLASNDGTIKLQLTKL